MDLNPWPLCERAKVRDQVTEPSAAGGRYSEAEEEKNKENREALQASGATMFFLGSRGYVQSTSATPTIKTKSGNTRCSLAFFFVLYGFVGLRKFVRIEKVTVHPITFSAANRRQNRRRRICESTTKKSELKEFCIFIAHFINHFSVNMSDETY